MGVEPPNPCPEETASALSRALFLWNDALIRKGFERPLQKEDVWDINADMTTEASAAGLAATGVLDAAPGQRRNHYLLRGLYRANFRDFWISALYRLGQELAQLVQPILLADILRFLENPDVPLSRGLLGCFLLFCAACTKTLLENHYFITCVRCGIRARAACVDVVYAKSLRLSAAARAEASTGQIVNLMQIDAQKFYDSSWGLHLVWAALLQIVGCVVLLFQLLGPSMLAGLFTMIVLIPVNMQLVKVQHQRRKVAAKKTDARVTTINEVLLAIRAVKLYAWEMLFAERISKNRQEELVFIRKLGINKSFISTLANVSPSLVTLAALLFFTAVAGNELDAATVFTSIALFENMKDPLARLPDRITSFVDLSVASGRLQTFLARDEVAPRARRGGSGDREVAISVEGSFGWGEPTVEGAVQLTKSKAASATSAKKGKKKAGDQQYQLLGQEEEEGEALLSAGAVPAVPALLRDLKLSIRQGELVYVIGTVGSGKSNLLAAILSEMVPVGAGASSSVDGCCAFVDQQPWILNMSLKKNILISGQQEPADEARYQEALRVTGLLEDLDALPGGDQTEIGERGHQQRFAAIFFSSLDKSKQGRCTQGSTFPGAKSSASVSLGWSTQRRPSACSTTRRAPSTRSCPRMSSSNACTAPWKGSGGRGSSSRMSSSLLCCGGRTG